MPDEQVISSRDLLIKGSTAVAGGVGTLLPSSLFENFLPLAEGEGSFME